MTQSLLLNKKGIALMHQLEPKLLWVSVSQGALEAIIPFLPFFFTSRILDLLMTGQFNQRLLAYVVAALLINFVVSAIANGLAHTRESLIYRAMDKKEMLLNKKMIHMDYQFVEDITVQEKLSSIRVNEMTGGIGMFRLFGSTKDMVKHTITILIGLLFIIPLIRSQSTVQRFFINVDLPWLIVLFFLSLIGFIMIVLYVNKWSLERFNNFIQDGVQINNLMGAIYPILNNFRSGKEIRMYHQGPIYESFFKKSEYQVEKTMGDINQTVNRVSVISVVLSYLILSFTYLWIIGKTLNGAISTGAVIQYTGASSLLIREMPAFLEKLTEFINNSVGLEQLFDFLDMKSTRHQGTLPVEKRLDNQYTLEARNVSFKYPGTDQFILKDINLSLSAGEKLAIVGMNGSGKTTFIKLICRLYDPTEGQILLNGIDIRKYNEQEYLSLLSVVFQDFHLYGFELGENVATSSEIDEDRIVTSLNHSGFSKRLASLKDGLKTYLYKEYDENGIEVSGGEAQKIAMARAIYKQAPIVILDEPTAALDPLSEYEMYTRFADVTGSRTTIYISHRLSSCRFCDSIAVFDEGRLVQLGSHQELVRQSEGKYYDLWQAQAQYYQKDETGQVQEILI